MKHTHKQREASAKRIQSAQQATPISDEIAAFYDSRRLTEADVDHLAEIYTEGRTFNRNSLRSSHE
jgi:ubiquinone biosynthesis protein UbiJ